MTAAERHKLILAKLRTDSVTTMRDCAVAAGCSVKTIQKDLDSLSASFPIIISRGNGGGVKLADWYHPKESYLSAKQLEVLMRLANSAAPEDRTVLNSIIDQFGPN